MKFVESTVFEIIGGRGGGGGGVGSTSLFIEVVGTKYLRTGRVNLREFLAKQKWFRILMAPLLWLKFDSHCDAVFDRVVIKYIWL